MMLRTMPVTTVQPQLQPIKPIREFGAYPKQRVRKSYCNTLSSYPDMSQVLGRDSFVLLPTGRNVRLDEIELREDQQQFYLGDFNITDYLTPDQKKYYPGWDIEAENNRLFIQQRIEQGLPYNQGGSTDVLSLFGQNVSNQLSDIASATPNAIAGIGKMILIGGAIYLAVQLVSKFPQK